LVGRGRVQAGKNALKEGIGGGIAETGGRPVRQEPLRRKKEREKERGSPFPRKG